MVATPDVIGNKVGNGQGAGPIPFPTVAEGPGLLKLTGPGA